MNTSLRLRLLTQDDIPFADHVRHLAGWNQTCDDWQRFLQWEPEGCFLAEWDGTPVGTATTLVYGSELAWIGMVLVLPEYRQRGIGRALLERCIRHLQQRGVRCIKLDATPLGKPVYQKLGFQEEWTLTRWVSAQVPARTMNPDPKIRPCQDNDLVLIEPLDTTAFGVSRRRIVESLYRSHGNVLVYEAKPGQVAGYGIIKPGSRAFYLGPLAAESTEVALELVAALRLRNPDATIYWDIPDQQTATVAWCQHESFTAQRSLTRMFLGSNSTPGDPRKQFALAGPEIG